MSRPAADVDADDRTPTTGVPARRTTNTTSGESASTSDATLRDARASTIAFLTTPELEWRRLEVERGTNLDRKVTECATREPVVRRERRQEVVEERLQAYRSARAQIPGDSRRRAVMANGYPCDGRLEGIEQRRFPLPCRFLDAHAERRAHHKPLQLRLHDPVCAARTGQAQLVATLCAHALPARFISSTTRTVGIITGEYKVAEADSHCASPPDTIPSRLGPARRAARVGSRASSLLPA